MTFAPLSRGIWIGVVSLLLALPSVTTLVGDSARVRSDGPMGVPNQHGYALSLPVGAEFTDGMELLRLDGGRDAVIEDVQLVGADGLELLGAKVTPPPRGLAAISTFRSWPPRHRLLDETKFVDAIGATVPARTSRPWELLIGLRVTRAGHAIRRAVAVTYRVGDERHRVEFPAKIKVCAGKSFQTKRGRCPF